MGIYLSEHESRSIESLKLLAENASDAGHKDEARVYYRKIIEITNKSVMENLEHASLSEPEENEDFVYSDLSIGAGPDEKLIDLTIHLVVGSPLFQKFVQMLKEQEEEGT